MKIVFFVHCFFPHHFYGTETYTLGLAQYYQASGHDITVVTAIFQGEPHAADLVTKYEYQGIPVVCIDKNRLPHSRVKETYYQPEMRGVLERILRDLGPDLVHVTHLINHTAALLEVTKKLGIATYATFTDFFGFCLNNKLEAANGALCAGPSPSRTNCLACHLKDASHRAQADSWSRLAKRPLLAQLLAAGANWARRLPTLKGGPIDGLVEDILQRPDTLIGLYNGSYSGAVAPTQFLRRAYENNGINVPMRNIWFGVDIDRSQKPKRSQRHKPVIGFIGQIAPHKGTDLLVKAFQRLPRNRAELRIYGPTDQDPGYMSTLKSLGTGYDIHFMGTFPKEAMAEILRDMDLLVIPSRWYENSPLVLLNALATHTPVLVSDVEGMTEFLVAGENGHSFKRGSVDNLEKYLRDLITTPDNLYSLANTTKYERTPKIMAEETLAVYR